MKKILLLLTFFFTPLVMADNSCDSAKNSDQLNNCLLDKKEAITKELNIQFKNYLSEIEKNYSVHMDIGSQLSSEVKESQYKWHEYMISTCQVYAFQVESGTRTHATITNQCISDMTENRIKEITLMMNSM